jgi:hypothetical protein
MEQPRRIHMSKVDEDQMARNTRLERAADQLHDVILEWFVKAEVRAIIKTRVEVAAWLVRLAEDLDGALFPQRLRGAMRKAMLNRMVEWDGLPIQQWATEPAKDDTAA